MAQCRHGLFKITDTAPMPRHAKLLVADSITRGNDEVVQTVGCVLYEINHGASLAAEKRIPPLADAATVSASKYGAAKGTP